MATYETPQRVSDPLERTIGAWVSRDFADEIAELARENCRSVSGEVRLALRKHLADARQGALTAA